MLNNKENILLYKDEHLSCIQYQKEVHSGFHYIEFQKGEEQCIEEGIKYHYLVAVLEGKCAYYSSTSEEAEIIEKGYLYLIPKHSLFNVNYLETTKVIIFVIDQLSSNCDKLYFKTLLPLVQDKDNYINNPVKIKEPLLLFYDLMKIYLQAGANCFHLHEMKSNEFFMNLRFFYSKEEIAHLLYPIIAYDYSFKSFIIETATKVNSIKELIELSHMSKSVFYERFKKEFGISAKQWMIQQFNHKVVYMASSPGVSVKELAIKLGFETTNQFQQYCKRHLNTSPSELIKRNEKRE